MTTRSEILNVATRLFGLHGFKEVTTRQISDAANCNIASVFYHFTNKETLYQECLSSLDFNPDLNFDHILISPQNKEEFSTCFNAFENHLGIIVKNNSSSVRLLLGSIDLGLRDIFEAKFLKPVAMQLEAFLSLSQKAQILSDQLEIKTAARSIVNHIMCEKLLSITERVENHGDEEVSRKIMKCGLLNYA